MERIRSAIKRFDLFDLLSLSLFTVVFILALTHWSGFPIFKDIYYHMGTATGFQTAGGVALFDFWEYAPFGRPHLYPPMLHIVMYSMNLTGLSMATIGKLVSFSAFHLVLLSTWYGMRKLFSSRAAFYTLVLLTSCFVFFWSTAVTSAASLVLILAPFVFIALEKDRTVTAAVLLGISLYSHLVLGHILAIALVLYALHRRGFFKRITWVLVGAYAMWIPWGLHILFNYQSLSFSDPQGAGSGVTIHILIWLLAIAGFVYSYFKKEQYYILPCLLLAMIPILFFYPNRFWEHHGFVPLAMLGGAALSGLHGYLKKVLSERTVSPAVSKAVITSAMAVPVILVLLFDPVFSTINNRGTARPAQAVNSGYPSTAGLEQSQASGIYQRNSELSEDGYLPVPPSGQTREGIGGQGALPPGNIGNRAVNIGRPSTFQAKASTILTLLGVNPERGMNSINEEPLLSEDTEKLAELICENSEPGQIVFANDSSLGDMITGLTGRPSTTGMFHEVEVEGGRKNNGDYLENAALIVVPQAQVSATQESNLTTLRNPALQGPGEMRVSQSLDLESLEYIGSSGELTLYKNPSVETTVEVTGTVVPWFIVFSILFGLAALVIVDIVHPLHPVRLLWGRLKKQNPAAHGGDTNA